MSWWSGRFLLYVIGFAGAAVLDAQTPLGVADWLIELILVWVAATWGGPLEIVAVAVAGTLTMVAGIWSSPLGSLPLWIGLLNRLVAIAVLWTIAHVARLRRVAEAERARAAAEIKVLQGLLPMCAGCKRIRAASGGWHSLETYLSAHSEAQITHTYCPECVAKYFPQMAKAAHPPR